MTLQERENRDRCFDLSVFVDAAVEARGAGEIVKMAAQEIPCAAMPRWVFLRCDSDQKYRGFHFRISGLSDSTDHFIWPEPQGRGGRGPIVLPCRQGNSGSFRRSRVR